MTGRARRSAGQLVRSFDVAPDPVLVTSLYVAADNVDRAEAAKVAPGALAYANAELRQARRELTESMGGGQGDDPFAGLDTLLRAAAVGNPTD